MLKEAPADQVQSVLQSGKVGNMTEIQLLKLEILNLAAHFGITEDDLNGYQNVQ